MSSKQKNQNKSEILERNQADDYNEDVYERYNSVRYEEYNEQDQRAMIAQQSIELSHVLIYRRQKFFGLL